MGLDEKVTAAYNKRPVRSINARPVKNLGYSEAGASFTRRALKSFLPLSGSPADDIDRNNETLRQRARLLYMSSPLATSAIVTNRTKVVGTGLTLKAGIDGNKTLMDAASREVWEREAESEFDLWASKRQNCDALGISNFYEMQQLAFMSWMMSGDVFALVKREKPNPLNPYSLRLHLVEADRVSTPYLYRGAAYLSTGREIIPDGFPGAGNYIYDGVEVERRTGRIVAYHICNNYPLSTVLETSEWTRVEAYGKETGLPNVLHVMSAERPDQYRGVPILAPVIEVLLQIRRYTESELMAALVQSFFTAWVTTSTPQSENPFNEVGAGDYPGGVPIEGMENNISASENEYEMGPGTVTHLADGENITFGNPNIPVAGFEPFVRTLARLVGAALEIPYDVLVKEFNSSYSASRGALLEAWEAFRMRRRWFVDDFCQPVYEMFLAEAVALGRLRAPGFFDDAAIRKAWCGAKWIGPIQGQLDPMKEANAALLLAQNGVKTYEQITRELGGGDWSANIEQLADENRKRAAAGVSADPFTADETAGEEETTDEQENGETNERSQN